MNSLLSNCKQVIYLLLSILPILDYSPCYAAGIDPETVPSFRPSELVFYENLGQVTHNGTEADSTVLFYGSRGALAFYLRREGVSYHLSQVFGAQVEMEESSSDKDSDRLFVDRANIRWIGANRDFVIETEGQLPGYDNFMVEYSDEPIRGVRSFKRIHYRQLFDHIDVTWYERDGSLEYDFTVLPGGDPDQIRWEIEEAESVYIDESGELVIQTPIGEIREQPPVAFQSGQEIPVLWELEGTQVGFQVGAYDPTKPLVIDPLVLTRTWGTYYGGSGGDFIRDITVDSVGNIYICGETGSDNTLSTMTGVMFQNRGGFIAKFSSAGNRIWGTTYAFTGMEAGALSLDAIGNIYITGTISPSAGGSTVSSSFSTTGVHQMFFGGAEDAFLAKFSNNGLRQWVTFYGGSSTDFATDIAIDDSNYVYIAGATRSNNNIASFGSYAFTKSGPSYTDDAFLAKFDTAGVRQWGTYFGGTGDEIAYSIDVDDSSNIYMVGVAGSNNSITTPGAHKTTATSNGHAMVVRFGSNGFRQWGTYYGGTFQSVLLINCRFDRTTRSLYTVGWTTNNAASIDADVVTPNVYQSTRPGGTRDGLIVRFTPQGQRVWGTYYGGSSNWDQCFGVDVDATGAVYVCGRTNSSSGIASPDGFDPQYGNSLEAYLTKLDTTGNRVWGTYYGGGDTEESYACAIDNVGAIYMVGTTQSINASIMTTPGAFQTVFDNSVIPLKEEGYIVKFRECGDRITLTATSCSAYSSPGGTQTWTMSGTYYDTLINVEGCDSLIVVQLTIIPPSVDSISVSACGQYSLPGSSSTWSLSGIYSDTLVNAAGCDSVVVVDLTILNSTSETITASSCGIYVLNGQSYTSTGTYTQQLTNAAGCDSTLTLNLAILNSTSESVSASACDTYTLNGQTYTSSGTYTQQFTNAVGCDSILTLNLTILNSTIETMSVSSCDTYTLNGQTYIASGVYTQQLTNVAGCDSTLTLNLTILGSTSETTSASACDSYILNSQVYTSSGTYTQQLANAAGCDSTLTLNLTILNSTSETISVSSCDTYTLNGQTYVASGTYTQQLINAAGCDSVLTLNVTILASTSETVTASACDSYTLNGQVYTSSGMYTQQLTNAAGCDSTLALNLTVLSSTSETISVSACDGLTLNGQTYTASGTYTQQLTNAAGCDSTLTVNLTILTSTNELLTVSACDGYTLNGQTYTATGTYVQQLTNMVGCDSTLTLDLTVLASTSETLTTSACDNYSLNGQVYTTSGTYTQQLTNTAGCDSILTLDLTILDGSSETITADACDSYTLNGITYTASGTYTQQLTNAIGCDSVLTLNLTLMQPDTSVDRQGSTLTAQATSGAFQWLSCTEGFATIPGATSANYTPDVAGEYAVEVRDNGCADTSSCYTVSLVGISARYGAEVIQVFPNPTTGIVYINWDQSDISGPVRIVVYNAVGSVIWGQDNVQGQAILNTDGWARGVYPYQMIVNGRPVHTGQLIRQ